MQVRFNRLTGWIPWDLGNMPRLRQLELDGNALSGHIPNSFKCVLHLALMPRSCFMWPVSKKGQYHGLADQEAGANKPAR